jgi:pimeloyl-ACP methyl ester carboxylesterase
MPELQLSAGTIEYVDTGGDGDPIVFLHGVVNDASVWRKVVAQLEGEHRCIAPTLPLGSHKTPMAPNADLTLRGIARLAGEVLERLELTAVTLVTNDWGGAQVMVAEGCADRVARLVLTSCEAFENYPPGIPGRMLGMSARLPGGLSMGFGALRIRPLRRIPLMFGWMSKRPVPAEVMDGWFRPMQTQREIRRDFRKYATSLPGKEELREITEQLQTLDRPALVAWAADDKIMPIDHGRRMAEMLPQGRFFEVPDSYTLIPEDQPEVLARLISDFVARRESAPAIPTPS